MEKFFPAGVLQVKEGDIISPDSVIILFQSRPIQAGISGRILSIHTSDRIKLIVECTHDVQLHGLCAICGQEVEQLGSIVMSHNTDKLFVSAKEAERLDKETADRLKQQRRLSLILDLDQTLIQATTSEPPAHQQLPSFVLEHSPLRYWIKLRPGWKEFLKDANQLFELHIYTMGTRLYANAVAHVLDPEKVLFRERILSRDESGSMSRKTLERLFPCDTSMVVVVDDRADVWNWSPNLIKVTPYTFFKDVGDINAPVGSNDLLPAVLSSVQDDNDHELEYLRKAMKSIHSAYFYALDSGNTADVRHIVPRLKQKVLKGVHIVFSAVIPLEQVSQHSDIWRLAESLGAKCSQDVLTKGVTHVVAAQRGTQKVNTGKRLPGVLVVHSEWLIESIVCWSRQPEVPYLLESPLPPSRASSFSIDDGIFDPFLNTSKIDWAAAEQEVEDELGSDFDEDEDGDDLESGFILNGILEEEEDRSEEDASYIESLMDTQEPIERKRKHSEIQGDDDSLSEGQDFEREMDKSESESFSESSDEWSEFAHLMDKQLS